MTYLQLDNSVLRRLREDEVTTVGQNSYSKLIGEFVNGVPNGYGTLISTKGIITYQGIWRKGKPASIYKKVSYEQRSR